MSESVGVRELRDHLSAVLRRVQSGEVVTVTEHGRPVAVLLPRGGDEPEEALRELARLGRVAWAGGKPAGGGSPPLVRGAAVADAVVGARR